MVHADVQAAVLSQRLPANLQPAQRASDRYARKGITEITEKGPVFEGKQYEVDVLIYATGFEVQKDRHLQRDQRARTGSISNDKHQRGARC